LENDREGAIGSAVSDLKEEIKIGKEKTAIDGTNVGTRGVDDISGGNPTPNDIKGVRIADDMILKDRKHRVAYLKCQMIVFERKTEKSVVEDHRSACWSHDTIKGLIEGL